MVEIGVKQLIASGTANWNDVLAELVAALRSEPPSAEVLTTLDVAISELDSLRTEKAQHQQAGQRLLEFLREISETCAIGITMIGLTGAMRRLREAVSRQVLEGRIDLSFASEVAKELHRGLTEFIQIKERIVNSLSIDELDSADALEAKAKEVADKIRLDLARFAGKELSLSVPPGPVETVAVLPPLPPNPLPPPLPPPRFDIHWSSLQRPEDCLPEITLGIDFGTARSKAFATKMEAGGEEWVELLLGHLTGEAHHQYSISSSVWINDAGNAFVGAAAVEHSSNYIVGLGGRPRRSIDSLKQFLSQGDLEMLEQPLGAEENPLNETVPLTRREALVLLLGYLFQTAQSALRKKLNGAAGRVRFALPCWTRRQVDSVRPELDRSFRYALLVAGSIPPKFWEKGVPIKPLRDLIAAIDRQPTKVRQGNFEFADPIPEAIAAGCGRLETGDERRQLVAIVDVGAGTTDFAVFHVSEDGDGVLRSNVIDKSVLAVRTAGDTLDDVLIRLIRERHADVFENRIVYSQIWKQRRRLKEQLLAKGVVEYRLANDMSGQITSEEFLRSQGVRDFDSLLEKRFIESLEAVPADVMRARAGIAPIRVLLTGGGASLPGVKKLASQPQRTVAGVVVRIEEDTRLPRSIAQMGPDFKLEFPQLAVAIGASKRVTPEVGGPFGIAPAPPPVIRGFAG